jgi:hypothetical protein
MAENKQPYLNDVFMNIMNEQVYTDAQKYRTSAAHGTSAGTVTNAVKAEKDVWTEVLANDESGKPILDTDGRVTMKKVKAASVISMCVGDYTNVATIMNNMEDYAELTGNKIQEIVSIMKMIDIN